MLESNPRRSVAARILFLFAALLGGSAALSQYWKSHRQEREWHDFPTAVGDQKFFPAGKTTGRAVVNGKSRPLTISTAPVPLDDRFMRRVGWLDSGGALYVRWESLQNPGKTSTPELARTWFVKTARNTYAEADSASSTP